MARATSSSRASACDGRNGLSRPEMIWTPRFILPQRFGRRSRQLGYISPFGSGFQEVVSNINNPATSASPIGTSITPGINDALGSYTEIISDTLLTSDAFGIWLCFSTNASSAQARPSLVNIGADPAGGTSYSDIITDLNAACAAVAAPMVGLFYYFPLFIKAGTALAARARVGNATANTLRVACRLYCKPTRPEVLRCGRYVDSIGADTANSRGTLITPGVSSAEGSYTSLGTLPRPAWWFQQGLSVDDSTMSTGWYTTDLAVGDVSNKDLLINNQHTYGSGSEQLSSELVRSCIKDLPTGAELFSRASSSLATADSNVSVVAHALGG